MKRYMLTLALSFGLLHVCVSASGGVPESPAQTPELGNDGASDDVDDDTRTYMALGENDLAPPSSTVGGHEKGGGDRWRLHPSPELLDALRAALAVESEVMELHNAKGNGRDDAYETGRTSGDWLSTLGTMHDGGLYGYDGDRQLPKRAPTGFTGMRGRRIPSGFNGMRGKKSLSLFSWNNQAAQGSDPKSYRDGKRAPSGFLGMRGKKSLDTSLDEQWSMDDLSLSRQAKEYPNFLILEPTFGAMSSGPYKRVPNGFMGLRGKKDGR